MIDVRTSELLEFDKILELVRQNCLSSEGVNELDSQNILTSESELDDFHNLISQFRQLLESDETFPSISFPPVYNFVPTCRKEGTSLSGKDLYDLAVFIGSADSLKKYISKSKIPDIENLQNEAEKIPDLTDIEKIITSVVNSRGQIRDDHPELRALRKGLGELNKKISSLSASYLTDNKNIWNTDVPSQKEGRIVLPLKSNFKSRIKGIIHDISSRGNVIYIEPFDLLELNNKIAIQEHEISIISNKIFRQLTSSVRERIDDIDILLTSLPYLDTLLARAKFSIFYNCHRPEISKNIIDLKGARHLLLGDSAVPIDIGMDDDIQVLIITGPNAGGKTVSLKTVGLLSMMYQFGLQIPADEGSLLPVFKGIYADIGDDQSIGSGFSTFSGHMNNISKILEKSEKSTLVLLDELGSGTDPGEGAAIAMAVLDTLIERGSIVLTTSHHGLLKKYGYTRKHVSNASMEFDSNSKKSTYRVVPGIPGDSHGIDIAKKSSIPDFIIKNALRYLDNNQSETGKMIEELENKYKGVALKESLIKEREAKLKEQIRKNDLRFLEIKQNENILRKKNIQHGDRFLSKARRELENLVRELREGELTREKTKKVKSFLAEIDNKLDEEKKIVENHSFIKSDNLKSEKIKPGLNVLIGEYRRSGVVVRKDKKNNWIINTGALKLSVNEDQIYPAPSVKEKESYGVSLSAIRSENQADLTLDIRGYRLEKALEKIRKQIDKAIISGLVEFSIIHGKGEGVLSNGVHSYLKKENIVKEYHYAHPEDGGFGKTIVVLKD